MSDEEQYLLSKIYFLEDTLFRSKNQYEINALLQEIRALRVQLSKLKYRTRQRTSL